MDSAQGRKADAMPEFAPGVSPFEIRASDEILTDLQRRLENVRLAPQDSTADCDLGRNLVGSKKDLSSPPREWAERFFRVVRWTEMPLGGHFAAMEQPDLLAEDIRAFFRGLTGGWS